MAQKFGFGTIFGTQKLFSKKYSRGKDSKHYTSCVLYIAFFSSNSQILDTKAPKRRVFSTPIIYRGKKIAAEVAASVKNFLISIYRTLQAIKHKVAATLSTIAATFCSIIIEAQKATESPQMSLLCSMLALIPQSGDFFGRCARSAFRRTTSGRLTYSIPISLN